VGLKKPSVLVAASVVCLIIGFGTPALAQGHGGGTPRGPGAGGPGGGGRGSGGPGAGGPVHPPAGGYYGGYYRYPYYGYRYYGYPYWYGWYGYPYFYAGWGWPYGPYPYYYGYGGAYDSSASLRLDVTPKEAEVYIDGYLAGSVDDFDGTFQRLRVQRGAHELTLYRDGFKTVHQSLHLSSGSTFKVSYKMEPLAPGEVAEARPTPPPPPPSDESEGAPAGPPEGRPSPQAPPRRPPPARSAAGFSTLAIRVQPADAIVLIDGERWQTSSGQDRLVVDVPQGPHRIEIRKEGFDTYSTEITTSQGETVPINVSLRSR
jgi:PEGA domain